MINHSGPTKQTKETARIGARIRRLRARGVKWERICRDEKILKEDGSPDPGLAYRIAFDDYEPKSQGVRDRLGLKRLCLACMRGFRNIASGSGNRTPWRDWWNRLKPGERDLRIRREYEKEER